MTDRMRRWLDEPDPQLDGKAPRQAGRDDRRSDVVRLVRGMQNGAECARRGGRPFAETSWMGQSSVSRTSWRPDALFVTRWTILKARRVARAMRTGVPRQAR